MAASDKVVAVFCQYPMTTMERQTCECGEAPTSRRERDGAAGEQHRRPGEPLEKRAYPGQGNREQRGDAAKEPAKRVQNPVDDRVDPVGERYEPGLRDLFQERNPGAQIEQHQHQHAEPNPGNRAPANAPRLIEGRDLARPRRHRRSSAEASARTTRSPVKPHESEGRGGCTSPPDPSARATSSSTAPRETRSRPPIASPLRRPAPCPRRPSSSGGTESRCSAGSS